MLDALQQLDASYQVLCCFTFELIHVEFLIFGPTGIFVVGTNHYPDALHVDNGVLMAGTHSLHRQTGNLWRLCHLVNLVIQKGYKKELMPRPILVTPNGGEGGLREFDSIALETPESLVELLTQAPLESVDEGLVQGMANYVRERYLR